MNCDLPRIDNSAHRIDDLTSRFGYAATSRGRSIATTITSLTSVYVTESSIELECPRRIETSELESRLLSFWPSDRDAGHKCTLSATPIRFLHAQELIARRAGSTLNSHSKSVLRQTRCLLYANANSAFPILLPLGQRSSSSAIPPPPFVANHPPLSLRFLLLVFTVAIAAPVLRCLATTVTGRSTLKPVTSGSPLISRKLM